MTVVETGPAGLRHMATVPNRPLGAGLRLAASATPVRLDHTFFENEKRPMLGAILLKKGWITPERLDDALAEARQSRMRLGEILLTRGWLFEGELAHALAEQFDLPYVDLAAKSVDHAAASLMPLEVARRMFAVPVRYLGPGEVLVAVGKAHCRMVPRCERCPLRFDLRGRGPAA